MNHNDKEAKRYLGNKMVWRLVIVALIFSIGMKLCSRCVPVVSSAAPTSCSAAPGNFKRIDFVSDGVECYIVKLPADGSMTGWISIPPGMEFRYMHFGEESVIRGIRFWNGDYYLLKKDEPRHFGKIRHAVFRLHGKGEAMVYINPP